MNRDSWGQSFLRHLPNTLTGGNFYARSREVWVSPVTYHPDTASVQRHGRNVLIWLDAHGIQATHLIYDRDTKFTKMFDELMITVVIKIVKSPI